MSWSIRLYHHLAILTQPDPQNEHQPLRKVTSVRLCIHEQQEVSYEHHREVVSSAIQHQIAKSWSLRSPNPTPADPRTSSTITAKSRRPPQFRYICPSNLISGKRLVGHEFYLLERTYAVVLYLAEGGVVAIVWPGRSQLEGCRRLSLRRLRWTLEFVKRVLDACKIYFKVRSGLR